MYTIKNLISSLSTNGRNFLLDFFVPLFCAYGIYAICAAVTFRSTQSFLEAIINQEYDKYDKKVKMARQFSLVLYILKMIIYFILVISGFLWLSGRKKYFNYFWPFQPFFMIPLLLLELSVNYIFPSKPSAIIGSIIITMDYQGKKNVDKLLGSPKESILDNMVIKLLKSDILGAFVTILATSKIYWKTDFKSNINMWLIFAILAIMTHCFMIQYWNVAKTVKLLKENKSTEELIYEWKANVITWMFIQGGLDPPTDEEMEVIIDKFDLFFRNYYIQVNDENDYSLNTSLLEGILTQEEIINILQNK